MISDDACVTDSEQTCDVCSRTRFSAQLTVHLTTAHARGG